MDTGSHFKADRKQSCPLDSRNRSVYLCKEAALKIGSAFHKELANSKYTAGCFYRIFGDFYWMIQEGN